MSKIGVNTGKLSMGDLISREREEKQKYFCFSCLNYERDLKKHAIRLYKKLHAENPNQQH